MTDPTHLNIYIYARGKGEIAVVLYRSLEKRNWFSHKVIKNGMGTTCSNAAFEMKRDISLLFIGVKSHCLATVLLLQKVIDGKVG